MNGTKAIICIVLIVWVAVAGWYTFNRFCGTDLSGDGITIDDIRNRNTDAETAIEQAEEQRTIAEAGIDNAEETTRRIETSVDESANIIEQFETSINRSESIISDIRKTGKSKN